MIVAFTLSALSSAATFFTTDLDWRPKEIIR